MPSVATGDTQLAPSVAVGETHAASMQVASGDPSADTEDDPMQLVPTVDDAENGQINLHEFLEGSVHTDKDTMEYVSDGTNSNNDPNQYVLDSVDSDKYPMQSVPSGANAGKDKSWMEFLRGDHGTSSFPMMAGTPAPT
ncbi:hypothetical protein ZWY2020_007875 [Hordeum vulgare]|nr:hypothetical protein ZWY2020_007875 [Hordeum vulgare]